MLSHFGFNQINCFILITHYQQKRHEYLLSELEPLAQKLKPGLLFKAVQFTMQLGKTYHTLTPQNYAAMLKLIDDKLAKTPELNCRFEFSFATSPDAFSNSKQRQLNQIYNTELNVEIFKKIVIQYFEGSKRLLAHFVTVGIKFEIPEDQKLFCPFCKRHMCRHGVYFRYIESEKPQDHNDLLINPRNGNLQVLCAIPRGYCPKKQDKKKMYKNGDLKYICSETERRLNKSGHTSAIFDPELMLPYIAQEPHYAQKIYQMHIKWFQENPNPQDDDPTKEWLDIQQSSKIVSFYYFLQSTKSRFELLFNKTLSSCKNFINENLPPIALLSGILLSEIVEIRTTELFWGERGKCRILGTIRTIQELSLQFVKEVNTT